MKKRITFLMVAMLTFSTVSISQEDSVYIVKLVDQMGDKSYLVPSKDLVVANETSTIGFVISAFIGNDFKFKTLYVKTVGLGGCGENDEIIILFENGEKIKKKSWKDFNCDGESYFNFTNAEIDMLRNNEVSKIRMTNGRSFKNFTGNLSETQKRWFIQLLFGVDNKIFEEVIE